jgi:hypothetical protein
MSTPAHSPLLVLAAVGVVGVSAFLWYTHHTRAGSSPVSALTNDKEEKKTRGKEVHKEDKKKADKQDKKTAYTEDKKKKGRSRVAKQDIGQRQKFAFNIPRRSDGPDREIVCGDVVAWLQSQERLSSSASIIASIADISETPYDLAEWKIWVDAIAKMIFSKLGRLQV